MTSVKIEMLKGIGIKKAYAKPAAGTPLDVVAELSTFKSAIVLATVAICPENFVFEAIILPTRAAGHDGCCI